MSSYTGWIDGLLPIAGPEVPDQRVSPCRTAAYLDGKRKTILQVGKQRPLIRLADHSLNVMTELNGELSCSVEELMDDTGMAKVIITYDNWLMDYITNQTMPVQDLHLIIDFVPTRPNWRTRWGGKITEINIKSDERGIHSIELTALSHREHAKRILIAANPIFPPEIQLPRMWVLPGPTRSICAASLAINLGRLFMPGWSTITNIFNPMAWLNPFGPDAFQNLNPLNWPIQVAFVNPLFDQSRWSVLGAAWTDAHTSFKDVMTDAGVMMRAYTYLTTDEDSPHVELEQLLTASSDLVTALTGDANPTQVDIKRLATPTRNCVVFAFEDKSGHTGPTGTVFDGLLDSITVTVDQLITPVTIDLRNGETYDPGLTLNGQTVQEAAGVDRTYLFEKLTLTAPAAPMVIWRQGEFNGMLTNELTWRKGSVKTVMTGSKSPSIVNDAQTFAIKYGLARISDAINDYISLFQGGVSQVPMSNGLDALYNGQLDNVLLAWQRYTDPIRAIWAGDHAFQEHFEQGSGTAYTLASVLTLRQGVWKTRPWASFKATAMNGQPWVCFVDYQLGDRVGFEHEGIIYVDNVFGIKWEWDWDKPIGVTLKIGEDKMKNDPFGAAFKTIAGVYKFASQIAGEGTLFG